MSDFPNWFNITAKDNFDTLLPKKMRSNSSIKALQIGAYTGDATEWIANNTKWELDDVDTWQGSQEDAHEQIDFTKVESVYDSRHKDNKSIRKWKMTSDCFFYEYYQQSDEYDFIYIDGDHTASQTVKDGLNAFQLLKPGGIIAFDDYTWASGKGSYYDPAPGVDAFHHICKDLIELLVANSQVWFKKL
jgi:predicted O-methyltransferase YrrM